VYVSGYASPDATFSGLGFTKQTGSKVGFLASLTDATLTGTRAAAPALAFYPNPAHTRVQVPAATAATVLTLLDRLGRTVRTAAGAQLSVAGLAPGLYVLRAATPGQLTRTGRLVVE
jgi:hypothetical protein